jgi:hypothetical protein
MKTINHFLLLSLVIAASLFSFRAAAAIPVTGEAFIDKGEQMAVLPALSSFVGSMRNGQASQLSGVYVPGVMAYPILQQPASDAAFVSTQPNSVTQFRMAGQFNSIGLLAHDYLAGAIFPRLEKGSDIVLVYGDGSTKYYRVFDILRYQALSPNSPYSNFVDLGSKKTLSAEQAFFSTYGLGQSTLVLQTCISTATVSSWGRLFVLARPIEATSPSLLQVMPMLELALNGASRSLSAMEMQVASR